MNRPTGVTILAVLSFIGAALLLLVGIGFMVGGAGLAGVLSQQGQGGAGIFAALGAAAGIVILLFGGVYLLMGIGLWKLKNWGRILCLVLTILGAVGQLPGLLATLTHFNLLGLIWILFWLAIDVWIIMYLLKPEIKAAFQGGQVRATSA
jgi:hypothetical protein